MLKDYTINQACATIDAFAEANQVDHLRAIELMVKHYTQLSQKEQAALGTFMEYTRG